LNLEGHLLADNFNEFETKSLISTTAALHGQPPGRRPQHIS
jgi:hypothetical protein